MTWLWTAADAAAATAGTVQGGWEVVTGLSIDTRTLRPGEMFVALAGENRDGHAFVADALAKGAGAALVSRVPEGCEGAPLLVVDDTLRALERLGAAARARTGARVIGVTGSVGKTGTKEMLRAMLAGQGRVHAAEKSFNNHWGVPLTLALMPQDTDFAVIEIGMNHAGEITPLSRLARPHVVLITTVEAVHLGNFGSEEEIADAKAEIMAGLEPGGAALLNADNRHFARLAAAATAAGARILPFGMAAEELRLQDAQICGLATVVRAEIAGLPLTFKIGAPGLHLARNALAALGAVRAAGGDVALAALALGRWHVPAGRGARWKVLIGPQGVDGEVVLIDESYNANPASMRAALAVLGASAVEDGIGRFTRGRRIALLGDMLELGSASEALHAALAEAPEMAGADLVFTAGAAMKALHDALPEERRGQWFPDSAAMAERARRLVDAGDVVMVKGSLGARMAPVVDAIKALGAAVPQTGQEEG